MTGLPVPDLIDVPGRTDGLAAPGTRWEPVTDTATDGASPGLLAREPVQGRTAPRLQGRVRLENSGGVVQVARHPAPAGGAVDAASRAGTRTEVTGTGQACGPHLHTAPTTQPMAGQRPPWHALARP